MKIESKDRQKTIKRMELGTLNPRGVKRLHMTLCTLLASYLFFPLKKFSDVIILYVNILIYISIELINQLSLECHLIKIIGEMQINRRD